jgi:hypothetical protein
MGGDLFGAGGNAPARRGDGVGGEGEGEEDNKQGGKPI